MGADVGAAAPYATCSSTWCGSAAIGASASSSARRLTAAPVNEAGAGLGTSPGLGARARRSRPPMPAAR
eukprot:784360-Alexandrium_andersonii.AAC.1